MKMPKVGVAPSAPTDSRVAPLSNREPYTGGSAPEPGERPWATVPPPHAAFSGVVAADGLPVHALPSWRGTRGHRRPRRQSGPVGARGSRAGPVAPIRRLLRADA